jgi:predicted secreted Zn-dependent protease
MADTAQQILDKYDQLEKEFDRVTNHGLNQGIKLQ